jgi:rod shape-determining protein MreC
MRNLLNFLARYHNLIIFIILEGLALYLLTTSNDYHNTRIINGIRGLSQIVEGRIYSTRSYIGLRRVNTSLVKENIDLRNSLERLGRSDSQFFATMNDQVFDQQYRYTGAEVIGNSVNRQKNFFTLNKGWKDSIDIDMAVATSEGIAGIIVGCSENYSVAMSLLNLDFRVSARIRSNGYFGSLNWDGKNTAQAILSEIPQHAPVIKGDTVETTAFSALFPEGLMIGVISDFDKSGSDFYRITVSLATDFRRLTHVQIIENLKKTEQTELEKQFQ